MKKIFPVDYTENELREFIDKNNIKIKKAIPSGLKEVIKNELILAQNQLLIISNLEINRRILEQNNEIKRGIETYKSTITKTKRLTYVLIILALLGNILNVFYNNERSVHKQELNISEKLTNENIKRTD